MSWLTNDLPYPQNVYSFEDQAGVTRTPFFMGYRGQMQRWKNSWRTYRLEFFLEGRRLRNLELWLWEYSMESTVIGGRDGYQFQLMPLISESNAFPPTNPSVPPEQYARIIEAPVITAMSTAKTDASFGYYRVTMTVETQYDGTAAPIVQQIPA